MHKRPLWVLPFMACLSISGAQSTPAQEPTAQKPPHFLRVTKDVVKPGKLAEFRNLMAARARTLASANWPRVSLALVPVTGGMDEIWFLTGYDSYTTWAKDRDEIEKTAALKPTMEKFEEQEQDLVSMKHEVVLVYHQNYSYRPDFDWSQMRCWDIITYHWHMGHNDAVAENRRIVLENHTKAKMDESMLEYATAIGAPTATFVRFRPLKSFEELQRIENIHGAPYAPYVTAEDHKRLAQIAASFMESELENYYCVDPSMTYVTSSWVRSNQDFWRSPSK